MHHRQGLRVCRQGPGLSVCREQRQGHDGPPVWMGWDAPRDMHLKRQQNYKKMCYVAIRFFF